MFELRQIGGALDRVPAGAGARGRLPGKILTVAVGLPGTPASAEALEAHVAKLEAALAPFENGQRYLNFVEHKEDTRAMYEGDAHARLAAIRAAYDPEGLLQGNHEIAPAALRRAA